MHPPPPPMASHSTCLLDVLVLGSLTKTLKRWELGRRWIPLALNSPCPLSFSYHPPSALHCQPGTCRGSGILTLLSKCGLHWATAKPASQPTGAGGRGPGRTRPHPQRWGATAKLLWNQEPPPEPLSPPHSTYVQVCVGHSEMCLSGCRGDVRCGKMSRAIVKIRSFIFGKPKALLSSCPGPGEDPLSWRPRSLDQGSCSAPCCIAAGLRTDLRHHLPRKAWPSPALGRGLGFPRLHGRPLAQEEGGARLSLCSGCSGGTKTHQLHGLVCSPMRLRDLTGSGVRKQQAHTAVLWGLSTSKEHSWDGWATWVCPPLS